MILKHSREKESDYEEAIDQLTFPPPLMKGQKAQPDVLQCLGLLRCFWLVMSPLQAHFNFWQLWQQIKLRRQWPLRWHQKATSSWDPAERKKGSLVWEGWWHIETNISCFISDYMSLQENLCKSRRILTDPTVLTRCFPSHPWRLGSGFLYVATTRGVTQHLLIHGLFCSPLLRVLLHQLGELRMNRLYKR